MVFWVIQMALKWMLWVSLREAGCELDEKLTKLGWDWECDCGLWCGLCLVGVGGESVHNVQDKETLSSEVSKRSTSLPVPLTSRTVPVCVSSPCLFLLPPFLSSIFPFPPLSLFLTVLVMEPRTLCILGKCFSVGLSSQPPPAQCLWFQVPKFDVICYPGSRYFCTFGCICIYL